MNPILEIQTQLIALETQGVNKEQKEILNKIWKSTSDLIQNSYETKKDHALNYIYEGARLINTHYLKHGREKYVWEALQKYEKGIDIYNELPRRMKVEVRDEVESSDYRHSFNEIKIIATDIEKHFDAMC
tara:strand:+ start:34878 stop:35267 length:390 start_codon:yes stop_codon:yes gene_type:complete